MMASKKYSDYEVLESYLKSKDKNTQIKILAELNQCRREDIIKILLDAGLVYNKKHGCYERVNYTTKDNIKPTIKHKEISNKTKQGKKSVVSSLITVDELKRRYIENGESFALIAKTIGVSTSTICRFAHANGIVATHKTTISSKLYEIENDNSTKNNKLTNNDKAEIIKNIEDIKSMFDNICIENTDINSIDSIINACNIELDKLTELYDDCIRKAKNIHGSIRDITDIIKYLTRLYK